MPGWRGRTSMARSVSWRPSPTCPTTGAAAPIPSTGRADADATRLAGGHRGARADGGRGRAGGGGHLSWSAEAVAAAGTFRRALVPHYEWVAEDAAKDAGEPAPPTPKADGLVARLQSVCPETQSARVALGLPEYLLGFLGTYVLVHDLGALPFESQARLFAKAFDEFALRHDRLPTIDDDARLLDEGDAEPESSGQQRK